MKRTIGILVTFLAVGMVVSYAQEDGFWTRILKLKNGVIGQDTGYIECWRVRDQSLYPERFAIGYYCPPTNEPYYLRWWRGGTPLTPPIDTGWYYSFIGWKVENGDTLFSDYTQWEYYKSTTHRIFDLELQYSTTRPTPPRRP